MANVIESFTCVILPELNLPVCHWDLLESKLSTRRDPTPGRISGVGSMACVGLGVGVAVAGNQSMVAVTVGVMVAVSVGESGVGYSVGVIHAERNPIIKTTIADKYQRLTQGLPPPVSVQVQPMPA